MEPTDLIDVVSYKGSKNHEIQPRRSQYLDAVMATFQDLQSPPPFDTSRNS